MGAMLLLVGIDPAGFATDVRWGTELLPLSVTVIVSLLVNVALGSSWDLQFTM
jgi:hypothetical protein